jgi:hypothetical protein
MKKAKKPSNTYHLLLYSESCTPKFKKFKTVAEADSFTGEFLRTHTDNLDDNWIDCLIQDVNGGIIFYQTGIEVVGE